MRRAQYYDLIKWVIIIAVVLILFFMLTRGASWLSGLDLGTGWLS